MKRLLLALIVALIPAIGWAQALQQGGSWTSGHVPIYASPTFGQPIVTDGGSAAGGGPGVGLSELNVTSRGNGPGPFASSGTGPLATHSCLFDNAATTANYHYLCFDANAQGGGLIAYGAAGTASQLPLAISINGTSYEFPFVLTGVVGPGSSTVGHFACWNNTIGTLLSDCNTFTATGGTTARTIQSMFGDRLMIQDVGAACDGVTNDSSAWVAAVATGKGIVVPKNCNSYIDANLSVTVPVTFDQSGKITVNTGKTVTLAQAPEAADQQQIFAGSGAVLITAGNSRIFAEWWGAVADNSTDSAPAFQSAVNALTNGGTIQALPGSYKMGCASADAVTITNSVVNIYGSGNQVTKFRPVTNCAHYIFVVNPGGQSGNFRDFLIVGDALGVAVTAYNYSGINCLRCGVSDFTHLQFYGIKTALNLPYTVDMKYNDIYIQQCSASCAVIGGGSQNEAGVQVAQINFLSQWSVFPGNAVSQLVIDSGAGELLITQLIAAGGSEGVKIQNTSIGGHRPEHIRFSDGGTNVDANAVCNWCIYSVWDVKLHGVESASTTSGPSILINAGTDHSAVDGVDIVGSTVRGAFTDSIYIQSGADVHITGSLIYGASSASGSTINTGNAVRIGANAIGVVEITGNMMKGNETYANFTLTQGRSVLIDSGALTTYTNGSGLTYTGALTITDNTMYGNAIAAITNSGLAATASFVIHSNLGDTLKATNSLGGNVALNNTGTYFDGPTVALTNYGAWAVTGTVVVSDTAGAAAVSCKLWDGTTVIASGFTTVIAASTPISISLSGYIAAPAANVKISCKDQTSTSGVIIFNSSGNSKDSTISAFRIN